MDLEAKKKWDSIYSDASIGEYSVSKVLLENQHLLPETGNALDVACGTGSDAIFLAKNGLQTEAWDISETVIDKLNQYAQSGNLTLNGEARDINANPPADESFDVIVMAHYLERSLIPTLISALKPGGLIFYQTFLKDVTPDYSGPSNPSFRLDTNELLQMLAGLQLVVYREEALIGDIKKGFRNEAMIVAQKWID